MLLAHDVAKAFSADQSNFSRVELYENDISTFIHYYQPKLLGIFSKFGGKNMTGFQNMSVNVGWVAKPTTK